jgi:hypothetical protein
MIMSETKAKTTVCRLALAVIVLATVAGSITTAAKAADNHLFPRTYHLYSCDDPDALAKYDVVVGYWYCDLAKMRAANPNGVFLLQPGLDTGNGSNNNVNTTYGSQDKWTGGTDTITDGQAANLGSIRAFDPYWDYLHNADGSLATVNSLYSGMKGWNLADPNAKGTPTLIAKLIAYASKQRKVYRNGWDGIYGDNWTYGAIGASWYYGTKLDTDRNGVVDDTATLRKNWDNNLTKVGDLLRQYLPGKIVGGNGIWYGSQAYYGADPQGWLKSANFTQFEHLETKDAAWMVSHVKQWDNFDDPYGRTRFSATLMNALNCDGTNFVIPSGADPNQDQYMLNSCVMKSMRFGLTEALLTDAYFEFYPYNTHPAEWWYDEYDGGVGVRKRGYLGKPTGDPQTLTNGVWRRDFDNGIALNNPTTSSQTVNLETTYKHL